MSPVFQFELIRAGRSRWHWALRVVYVALLLGFLVAIYSSSQIELLTKNGSHLRALKETASTFYERFRFCQLIAVILLAPVLTAHSMIEEKSRRTLEFLLCSRIWDAEIVGSKLLLGLLRVWEVVLAGLPLCALCFLLGGLSPGKILADFLIAMGAAWVSCALALLIAVWASRFAEALLVLLLVQTVWYSYPLLNLLIGVTRAGWGSLPLFVTEWNAFLLLKRTDVSGLLEPTFAILDALIAMALFGFACALLAWWSLRPGWALSQNTIHNWIVRLATFDVTRSGRRRRERRVVGEPMMWRELRQRRGRMLDRILGCVIVICLVVCLVVDVAYWDQAREVVASRNATPQTFVNPPVVFWTAMFSSMFYLGFVGLPFLGILGVTACSEERDLGVWDFLLTSLLTREEIVRAKAARLLKAVVVVLSVQLFALAGNVACGLVPMYIFFALALHCLSVGVLIVMLGFYLGLRLRKGIHAVLIMLIAIGFITWGWPMFVMATTMGPDDFVFTIVSPSPCFHPMFMIMSDWQNGIRPGKIGPQAVAGIMFSLGYLAAAACLYRRCLSPIGPWAKAIDADDYGLVMSEKWFKRLKENPPKQSPSVGLGSTVEGAG